jgi:hypothetical protein
MKNNNTAASYNYMKCPDCGAENQIKNQFGCDPNNVPTKIVSTNSMTDEQKHQAGCCSNLCKICSELEYAVKVAEIIGAAEELMEILRWQPKGPQHDAMVKLANAITEFSKDAMQ